MYRPVYSTRFKKDVLLAMKRGKDMGKLATVVELLCTGDPLPERYRDHPLSGRYAGFRDCHIEPDWVLLYRIEKNQLQLILVRMGTHSDLF
ncbi:MAG: type II toxin-antitoxin system YafQ family toxin [Kiritimatiellae bacterium]|nr:type II toxin-antitoxin system YafQ family toxin [Kiritimatiellia bacterium]